MEALVAQMKPGVILVKKVVPELSKGPVIRVKEENAYKRGVVQSIGYADPHELGFMEGDVVYYMKAVQEAIEGDYVEHDKILCKE